MKVIDLLNKIANGEIEDKRTFNIRFKNGLYRSIYYDKEEENCMCCLKNVSDYYSIYDDISFDDEIETIEDEIETIEEDKKIRKLPIEVRQPNNFEEVVYIAEDLVNKINEIIDYINKEK